MIHHWQNEKTLFLKKSKRTLSAKECPLILYINTLISAKSNLCRIVRSFLSDINVMRVAFLKTSTCNSYKL